MHMYIYTYIHTYIYTHTHTLCTVLVQVTYDSEEIVGDDVLDSTPYLEYREALHLTLKKIRFLCVCVC